MNYVLETENLTKDFGSFRALDRVSVKLESGKIYGLIGRNGAGKTTLMRLVAGLSFPSEVSLCLDAGVKKPCRRSGSGSAV